VPFGRPRETAVRSNAQEVDEGARRYFEACPKLECYRTFDFEWYEMETYECDRNESAELLGIRERRTSALYWDLDGGLIPLGDLR
jgi:hypothetical protein